jgi:hypothetical protein
VGSTRTSHETDAALELVDPRSDVLETVRAEHAPGCQQLNELEAGRLEPRRSRKARDVFVIMLAE